MKPLELRRAGLAAGALALVFMLAWLLLRPAGIGALPEPPPVPAPAPPAVRPEPAPPQPPPPSAAGVRLYGLLGRGAIIGLPDGRQRLVAIGREVVPGLRVARIEQHSVILASAGGELRLGFDGAAPNPPQAGAARDTAAASAEEALRDETLRYRLGLAPRRAGTRTAGFVVRPGVSMPALDRAGLLPGDVILSVNGSRFDEERMLELAWEIANTPRTEFIVERGGRRIRLALNGTR